MLWAMKNLLSITLFIFTINLYFAQNNVLQTVQIDTEIFCDHCLQCESCDENIFNKLKENNQGIRLVKVDAKENVITIKFNSEKTNLQAVEKSITMAGYKANYQKPNDAAYERLDGCCKKK
jgi:copper chaperone CopZ